MTLRFTMTEIMASKIAKDSEPNMFVNIAQCY